MKIYKVSFFHERYHRWCYKTSYSDHEEALDRANKLAHCSDEISKARVTNSRTGEIEEIVK